MAASSATPLIVRLVSASVAIANRAGSIIRKIMKDGSLNIVQKVRWIRLPDYFTTGTAVCWVCAVIVWEWEFLCIVELNIKSISNSNSTSMNGHLPWHFLLGKTYTNSTLTTLQYTGMTGNTKVYSDITVFSLFIITILLLYYGHALNWTCCVKLAIINHVFCVLILVGGECPGLV